MSTASANSLDTARKSLMNFKFTGKNLLPNQSANAKQGTNTKQLAGVSGIAEKSGAANTANPTGIMSDSQLNQLMSYYGGAISTITSSALEGIKTTPLTLADVPKTNHSAGSTDSQYGHVPKTLPDPGTAPSKDVMNLFTGGSLSDLLVYLSEQIGIIYTNYSSQVDLMSKLPLSFAMSMWSLFTNQAKSIADLQRKESVDADNKARDSARDAGGCAVGTGIGEMLGAILLCVCSAFATIATFGGAAPSLAVAIPASVGIVSSAVSGIVMAFDGGVKANAGLELLQKAEDKSLDIHALIQHLSGLLEYGIFQLLFSNPGQAQMIFNIITTALSMGSATGELLAAKMVPQAVAEETTELIGELTSNLAKGVAKAEAALEEGIEMSTLTLENAGKTVKSGLSKILTSTEEGVEAASQAAGGATSSASKGANAGVNAATEAVEDTTKEVVKAVTKKAAASTVTKTAEITRKVIILLNSIISLNGMVMSAVDPEGKKINGKHTINLWQAMSSGFAGLAMYTLMETPDASSGETLADKMGQTGAMVAESVMLIAFSAAWAGLEYYMRKDLLPPSVLPPEMQAAITRMGIAHFLTQVAYMTGQTTQQVIWSLESANQEQAAAIMQRQSSDLMMFKVLIDSVTTQTTAESNTFISQMMTNSSENYGAFLKAVKDAINGQTKAIKNMIV